MNNEIKEQIIVLLVDELNVDKNEVQTNTSLSKDLGVDGDDAYDLIKRFSKEFNVNIDNFNFKNYFGSEVSFVFRLFKPFQKKQFNNLTVLDLINAAESKKLE